MTTESPLEALVRSVGRGFILNFGFDAALQALVFVQTLVVPRLIGPENLGLFALASAAVGSGLVLKQFGITEKLVQEDEASDLPLAYSVAFTLELGLAAALFLLVLGLGPLLAHFYHRGQLVPVVAALALTVFTAAFLDLPSALYLRQLRYTRHNLIAAAGPLASVLVTFPLAFAGAGVWSLVGGALAGLLASIIVMTLVVPLRPRLRLDGPLVRRFIRYGWPLWLAGVLGLSTTWSGTLIISSALGIAALGYFALGQSLAQQAFRLDAVLAYTLFPALCRTQDDPVGQRRAFVAINRVTVMWAGPVGLGLAVFAPDLVRFVLGPRWHPAIFLFQMQGLAVTLVSVGYSWDSFLRARGETKPTLVFHAISEAWVFIVLLPAVVLGGLRGAAWAIALSGPIAIAARQIMVRRLFPDVNLLGNASRELVASGAAAAVTAGIRAWLWRPASLVQAVALGLLFVVLCAASLGLVDREFLSGLLRRVRAAPGEGPPGDGPNPAAYVGQVVGAPEEIQVPGTFPLYLTPAPGGQLWVTIRDSSSIALLDSASGAWRTWRLPAYPHVACVDGSGRAWSALTLSGTVARVDPEVERTTRIRLGRSRELLVAAWDGEACLVVDAGRLLLWRIGETGVDRTSLPPGMVRPDFVVVDRSHGVWVTDTGRPALGHFRADGRPSLLAMPGVTRAAVIDDRRSRLWVGHAGAAMASRLSLEDGWPEDVKTYPLPGIPFGIAVGPDGRLWAALPEVDEVVALSEDGDLERRSVPSRSRPMSVAWVGSHLYVSCASTSRLLVWT